VVVHEVGGGGSTGVAAAIATAVAVAAPEWPLPVQQHVRGRCGSSGGGSIGVAA